MSPQWVKSDDATWLTLAGHDRSHLINALEQFIEVLGIHQRKTAGETLNRRLSALICRVFNSRLP
ncbi:MAG: hypothetical protein HYT88_02575, partial [Candidatus Omnitrophica bacterium]|nr:hypothetical protein [Candidatus Omnitrophota bacterium]